jgi:hypothetical protein
MTTTRTARAKSAQEEADENAAMEQVATAAPVLQSGVLPPVAVAIARVAADIGAIAKAQKVQAGPTRFNFRGIDDVLNAIHDPLVTHGVSIIPTGFDVLDQTVGQTKSGTAQQHLLGIVHYRIVGPAGDFIEAAVVAEAQDTSDKAASKLMSMAYKYLAFQTFSIPVEGALEESDRESYDRAPQQQAPLTSEAALAHLQTLCDSIGKPMEEVTNQFRERQGGIDMDAFRALPSNVLVPFVQQVDQYLRRQQAAAQQ